MKFRVPILALLALSSLALATPAVATEAPSSDVASSGTTGQVRNADPFQAYKPDIDDDEVDPVAPATVREVAAPGEAYPHILFLAENSCKMKKKFKGSRKFLFESAPFYDNMHVHLAGRYPKVVLFQDASDLANYIIDSRNLSTAEMLERLANLRKDPKFYDPKKPYLEVPFSMETTAEDIAELLAKFGTTKRETPDASIIPTINEDDDDRPDNKPFDVASVLKEETAPVPTEAELEVAAAEFAKFVARKEIRDAAEDAIIRIRRGAEPEEGDEAAIARGLAEGTHSEETVAAARKEAAELAEYNAKLAEVQAEEERKAAAEAEEAQSVAQLLGKTEL